MSKNQTIADQYTQEMLELTVHRKSNNLKSRFKRMAQAIAGGQKVKKIASLPTHIGTYGTKYKNKTIIEVGEPQNDYKFLKKIKN